MKKCIVIPDSFKGTLSSIELCEISQGVINRIFPECMVITLPVSDGGEGTVDCFLHAMGGERIKLSVSGPYHDKIEACYARIGDIAVIEMATAAGMTVDSRKNPALATTYGVGTMMKDAIEKGAKKIILGLGGSATNDGGCGCAAALGVNFIDANRNAFIPTGATLDKIKQINFRKIKKSLDGVEIVAMCDVDNLLYGKNGAAYTFAPQKGAGPAMVKELDMQLRYFESILFSELSVDVSELAGAGAAGGFGAGAYAFFGAQLKSGIETVLDLVRFDDLAVGAQLVITGEGCLDSQSLRGKTVYGVARRAKKLGVPVVAVVGDVEDDIGSIYDIGVSSIFSTNHKAILPEQAEKRARADYAQTMEDIMRLIKIAEKE